MRSPTPSARTLPATVIPEAEITRAIALLRSGLTLGAAARSIGMGAPGLLARLRRRGIQSVTELRPRHQRPRIWTPHANRVRPAPAPQEGRGDLPPKGVLLADDDGSRVQCHVCGRWYGKLPHHITRTHHLTVDAYKEQYDLARGLGLIAPAVAAKLAANAVRTGFAERGKDNADALPARVRGVTTRLSSRIRISQARRPDA